MLQSEVAAQPTCRNSSALRVYFFLLKKEALPNGQRVEEMTQPSIRTLYIPFPDIHSSPSPELWGKQEIWSDGTQPRGMEVSVLSSRKQVLKVPLP